MGGSTTPRGGRGVRGQVRQQDAVHLQQDAVHLQQGREWR